MSKATTQALMATYLICGSSNVAAPMFSAPDGYSKAQKAKQGGKKRGKGKPNAR